PEWRGRGVREGPPRGRGSCPGRGRGRAPRRRLGTGRRRTALRGRSHYCEEGGADPRPLPEAAGCARPAPVTAVGTSPRVLPPPRQGGRRCGTVGQADTSAP